MIEQKKAPFSGPGESGAIETNSNNKDSQNSNNAGEEKNILPYIRIGVAYYKRSIKPLTEKRKTAVLLPWRKQTIRDDHSEKDIFDRIPKFDGKTVIPSHTNFQQEINNYYNDYHPLKYSPESGGNCDIILMFIRHIFKDDYEMGLDYVQLLYLQPTQKLPVLCLVSKERNTGKTSFLNFLKEIFGLNVTVNTVEDFRSQFNSDIAAKLIIGIEEVKFDKLEDTEKIKFLSTTNSFKSQQKGVDREEVFFFGKFILVSNHADNFIKIEMEENRFWIHDVDGLVHDDVNIMEKIRKEIPYFLHLLVNRELSKPNVSRMWFAEKDIKNSAFRRVVSNNISNLERELLSVLMSLFESVDEEELYFQIFDLHNLVNKSCRTSVNEIRKLVKNKWNLQASGNTNAYQYYSLDKDGQPIGRRKKGRFYTFTKKWIMDYSDDLMID